jgi:hypothetical protein
MEGAVWLAKQIKARCWEQAHTDGQQGNQNLSPINKGTKLNPEFEGAWKGIILQNPPEIKAALKKFP